MSVAVVSVVAVIVKQTTHTQYENGCVDATTGNTNRLNAIVLSSLQSVVLDLNPISSIQSANCFVVVVVFFVFFEMGNLRKLKHEQRIKYSFACVNKFNTNHFHTYMYNDRMLFIKKCIFFSLLYFL